MRSSSCSPREPRRESGYILLAALVVLALMALVAGQLAWRLDLLRGQSAIVERMAEGLLAADNARARILHDLTTEPLQSIALGASARRWRLDGEPMPMPGGVVASLQDHRGLVSVNVPARAVLTRLMIAQGVAPERVDQLLDALNDYTDTDGLRRLTGAEQPEYDALGLRPPRDDWVDSAEELRQIIGWRDLGPVLDRLLPLLSSQRDGSFNPNTAPREVLMARLPGVSAEQINAFMARRQMAPFRSPLEARTATGFPFSDNDVFSPGPSLRLRLRIEGLPVALEYNLLLTPESSVRPWFYLDSRTVFVPASPPDDGSRPVSPSAALAAAGPN